MIKLKYSVRNFELSSEQKDLILEKVNRHFDKYKEDIDFDAKFDLKHREYILGVHSNFKSHKLDAKDSDYDIYKAVDKVIAKISAQIGKVESINASHK